MSYKHVMAWFFRILMIFVVIASCVAGWHAGGAVTLDLQASDDEDQVDMMSSKPMSSLSIESKIAEELNTINGRREASKDKFASKTVFLEKVSYERSAGAVVARGSLSDWGNPRSLVVVIDAFDENGTYVRSSSSNVSTRDGSTSFSVSIVDDDVFQKFAVRFLDQNMEDVVMRSFADERKIPPLLLDDPVHSSDLVEVAKRLVLLGYAKDVKPLKDEIVAAAIISRFRADYGLKGPGGVTIGDLLALRLVSPPVAQSVDLSTY